MARTSRLARRTIAVFLAQAIALPAVASPAARLDGPDLLKPALATAADLAPPAVGVSTAVLRKALQAIDDNDLAAANAIAASLPAFERDIVTWMAIRRDVSGLTPQAITDFAARNPDWPSVAIMRRRAEASLARQPLPPADVVAAFAGSRPITEQGTLALTRALTALGRKKEAAEVLGRYWTTDTLSPQEDAAILREFGDVLTRAQHRTRFDLLMYNDRIVQAASLAARLGPGYVKLATARAAVVRGEKTAGKKLDQVPPEVRKDAVYLFSLAEWHRRNDRAKDAAKALLKAPTDPVKLVDPDHWWIERRIVSRDLAENGNAALAYKVASAHKGGDNETLAEAHFHAGWYALRFLKDHATATRHFQALADMGSKPITRSRANYWLGRCAEAAGRLEEARGYYLKAAADPIAFYGQLAKVKLGIASLGLPPVPEPATGDAEAFARHPLVRVLSRLVDAGYEKDARTLYPELARLLPTPGQITLLTQYAERLSDHRSALQVGKIASERDLGVERLAYPLEAIPTSARTQTKVEAAMVYAIARQESAFDPAAVSGAGAMGLLQLLPSTAQATARNLGVGFSRGKLTTDPSYNAKLGAAHLRELVDEFDGSYILTFAAYNAGKRRVHEWIQRFGDPRDPRVDPVDWIESIPYGETRNYVQRVTENLQVYRERLTGSKLAIADDLRRGAGS